MLLRQWRARSQQGLCSKRRPWIVTTSVCVAQSGGIRGSTGGLAIGYKIFAWIYTLRSWALLERLVNIVFRTGRRGTRRINFMDLTPASTVAIVTKPSHRKHNLHWSGQSFLYGKQIQICGITKWIQRIRKNYDLYRRRNCRNANL
eukprot:g5521.t1